MRSRRKQKQRARHVEPASQLPEEVTIAGLECVQAAEQSELDNFCPEAEERQAEREWDMYYEKWLD